MSGATAADVAADPVGVNAALGTSTTFVDLLGRPAVVVPPRGAVPAGLRLRGAVPAGLQLIGRRDGDAALASLAATC